MAIYALGDLVPDIAPDAYVHPDAVVIGDVTIGSESTIWPGAVLRGDSGPITIGERTSIQDGSVIHTTEHAPTRVGNDCVIGHLVHLEGCLIEDGSLVGSGAVVLHMARVRPGALVGAGADQARQRRPRAHQRGRRVLPPARPHLPRAAAAPGLTRRGQFSPALRILPIASLQAGQTGYLSGSREGTHFLPHRASMASPVM